MSKLIFRGASVRYSDTRMDESGVFSRIYMTAAFSDPVREEMGWGAPPEGFTSAKLEGRLNATHIILTPNSKELRQHELQIDVNEISDFQFARVKNEGSESTSTEVRFVVRTAVDGAAALIEQYLRKIGKSEGQLRVNYEKQEELPGMEAKAGAREEDGADDAPNCVDCENSIGFMPGDYSTHLSGQKCDRYVAPEETESAGPSLSPAVLVGGTHQKGTRGRRTPSTEIQ